MRPHPFSLIVALAAVVGFVFATFSTYDFMAHLDRQVHGIHCSFLPGIEDPDATGTSGCQVTLMSPYSSVMRESVWGGIPISLPAMSVFAFLLFWAVNLILARRQEDVRATGFLLLATLLPVGASIAMGIVSLGELDAVCKLCIGIYAASGLALLGALAMFVRAMRKRSTAGDETAPDGTPLGRPAPMGFLKLAGALAVGVVFVLVPVVAYAAVSPDFESYIGSCGGLPSPDDPNDVLVSVGSQKPEVEVVEVFDPLCPACRGFEERFEASRFDEQVSRQILLFPLDDECNWMVDSAIHPGACTVSEAVLCAEGRQKEVIDWAFANQERIVEAEKKVKGAAEKMVLKEFPGLKSCVGEPEVQAELNQALRWAVDNRIQVLTPQLYVDGVKLCDADTDLGMDYMMSRLITRARSGKLRPEGPTSVGGGDQ